MRILLTSKGAIQIQELSDLKDTKEYKESLRLKTTSNFPKAHKKYTSTSIKFNREKLIQKKHNRTQQFLSTQTNFPIKSLRTSTSPSNINTSNNSQLLLNTYNTNTSQIQTEPNNINSNRKNNSNSIVKINLKRPKFNFPERILANYISDHQSTDKIIYDKYGLPELSTNKNNKLNNDNVKDEKFSFGEILGPDKVNLLKHKLISDNKMKNNFFKLDNNNFRSEYKIETDLEKLNSVLEYKKIKPANINLIRFINKNNNLNITSLNKIISFDDEKMDKSDKICKTVFNCDIKKKIFDEFVSKKIENKIGNMKNEFCNDLKNMKKDIVTGKEIIQGYMNKPSIRNNYREIYYSKVKYWEKYNIDRLCRKKKNNGGYVGSMDESMDWDFFKMNKFKEKENVGSTKENKIWK